MNDIEENRLQNISSAQEDKDDQLRQNLLSFFIEGYLYWTIGTLSYTKSISFLVQTLGEKDCNPLPDLTLSIKTSGTQPPSNRKA